MEAPLSERTFASDNFAPAHPKVMEAIVACNSGHAMAYGGDDLTKKAQQAFSKLFGRDVGCHFVFNGTAANLTALMAFQKSYGSVLCSDAAHIANDESTAPERFLGMRLSPIATEHGKISPEGLRAALGGAHGVHHPVPVALSLTQPTELGTVYTLDELKTLTPSPISTASACIWTARAWAAPWRPWAAPSRRWWPTPESTSSASAEPSRA